MTHDALNHYPNTIEQFDALKQACGVRWKPMDREPGIMSTRLQRQVLHDPEMGIYYSICTCETVIPDIVPNAEYFMKQFLGLKENEAQQEINCFLHAKDLGFYVPEHHVMAFEGKTLDISADELSLLDSNGVANFRSVLSVSEVKGTAVAQVLKDLNFDEEKKSFILNEAMCQGLILGLLYADYDRGNPRNIIIADLEQDRPEQFFHFDFEEAGKLKGEELFHDLVQRVQGYYKLPITPVLWERVDKRLEDVADRLMEPMPSVSREQKAIYDQRIAEGREHIRKGKNNAAMSFMLNNLAEGMKHRPHVQIWDLEL